MKFNQTYLEVNLIRKCTPNIWRSSTKNGADKLSIFGWVFYKFAT